MTAVLHRPMTLAEFLAWEERQALRWEFDGFQPVAMTGGTAAHEMIVGNLWSALKQRLGGKPCQAFGSNLKIQVMGRIRYPDAFVVCSPVAPRQTVITDPVVVFEVLSEGTSRIDRFVKLVEYQATPSIRRYVMLEQDLAAVTALARKGDEWINTTLTEGDTLELPEIGVSLPLAEIYAGLEFPDLPDDGR
jgi:Uma2 family endonuclease